MVQCQKRLLENVNKRTIKCEGWEGEDRYKEQRFVECPLTLNKMLINGHGETQKEAEEDVEGRYKKEILGYCETNCPVLSQEEYKEVVKRFNVVYVEKRGGMEDAEIR